MNAALNRYATPLISGMFAVSLVSGAALFLHVGPRALHSIHEWLGIVLVAPFALHLWKNWRPFRNYFRHAPMLVVLSLSAVLTGAYLLLAPQSGTENPAIALVGRLTQNSPNELAVVLDTTPDAITEALAAQGIMISGLDEPLAPAVAAAGKSPMDVARTLSALGG